MSSRGARTLIRREPILASAPVIAPWNVPYAMAMRKIAHATGPGQHAGAQNRHRPRRSAAPMIAALAGVGGKFRVGVLNAWDHAGLAGCRRGAVLHPCGQDLSLTGSSEVGRQTMAMAGRGSSRSSNSAENR
ncbi:MAG: aldehyde dehydrogenase family protein [Gammaproteobacteria bacterium]|nr:aldehyde dehydrogenase family protein [Gammaproteobacteria bacterium]